MSTEEATFIAQNRLTDDQKSEVDERKISSHYVEDFARGPPSLPDELDLMRKYKNLKHIQGEIAHIITQAEEGVVIL